MELVNVLIALGGFLLTIISVFVALAISWGKFDKRLGLMHQKMDIIESNHLAHIQAAMEKIAENMVVMRDGQIRMEEFIKGCPRYKV